MSLSRPLVPADGSPSPDEAGVPRVLFLDDDATMRNLFVRTALVHGIRARAAATIDEMYAQLESARPDGIVLDFHVSSDATSAEAVRELVRRGHLVAVWTGDPASAREAIGDMTPVIAKSSDGSEVFREVIRLIRARAHEIASAVDAGDLEQP